MIDIAAVRAVARAEARVARRLVRYWVFLVLSALFCASGFANFNVIHYFFSGGSASAASANPRFFLNVFGLYFVLTFCLLLVFLAFDVRARDQRERMADVLDARPYTNIELLAGKMLGLLVVAWIPAIVVMLLLEGVGLLLTNPFEPRSMPVFALFMAPPAFVFAIGLVFFLTLLVRHRLVAALLSLAVIFVLSWVSLWWVPLYAIAATDLAGGFIDPASDLLRPFASVSMVLQRLAYLLAGVALLLFSAAIHPRPDDGSRSRRALVGGVVMLVALGLLGGIVLEQRGHVQDRVRWAAVHESRKADPAPDLTRVAGQVTIDPGRRLALDLTLGLRAPATAGLQHALFTLNPGMIVREVHDSAGTTVPFTHQEGLLDLTLPRSLGPGEETSIQIGAEGRPDMFFGYLRGAFEPWTLAPAKAQVTFLGIQSVIFERNGVALLPGAHWLPTSGAEGAHTTSDGRATDFFTVDLTVDAPAGWLVAGPGRRRPAEPAAGAGRVRYRFAPGGPLPEVALVAGEYDSYLTEVDGVAFETLIHPSHRKNPQFFDVAGAEIRGWLSEHLAEAKRVGLAYPYDGLTLVEVPAKLRGYAGGWRMDTTFGPPAMILMREAGFPTARFDTKFRMRDYEEAEKREGGVARAKLQTLLHFFENDMNGGNPFLATARSFLGDQTLGAGPEGLALDFTLEGLTSQFISDRQGYFSAHFFRDQNFGNVFQEAGMASGNENRVGQSYADVFTHLVTSTPEVWEAVLGKSLVEMDPWENPKRMVNALTLKGGAMARSILDALGREQTGRLLAALRARTAGREYTREDLIAAGDEIGVDLRSWLDVWIDGTGLAGFVLGPVTYQRLTDGPDGSARYQTLVTLRNDEPAAGVVRLGYIPEGTDQERAYSAPATVPGHSAVELGIVSSVPLRTLRVEPYFSLNRDPFSVSLPELDRERTVPGEAFNGVRASAWTEPATGAIVVDDLDPGFAIESGSAALMRVAGRGDSDAQHDLGLPISDRRLHPQDWSRTAQPYTWGRYRRTAAVVRSGDGKHLAVFSATIPASGRWELEYYVSRAIPGASSRLGKWKLDLDAGSDQRELVLDAATVPPGWHSLGLFDLAPGVVKLKVRNATDGWNVTADAIRWTPAEHRGDVAAAR